MKCYDSDREFNGIMLLRLLFTTLRYKKSGKLSYASIQSEHHQNEGVPNFKRSCLIPSVRPLTSDRETIRTHDVFMCRWPTLLYWVKVRALRYPCNWNRRLRCWKMRCKFRPLLHLLVVDKTIMIYDVLMRRRPTLLHWAKLRISVPLERLRYWIKRCRFRPLASTSLSRTNYDICILAKLIAISISIWSERL